MKIPDTSDASVDMNITFKECKQRCLRNCSCVAYASAYHESKRGAIGCLTWHSGMLDARTYLSSGQDFYIRVDKEELGTYINGFRYIILFFLFFLIKQPFCFTATKRIKKHVNVEELKILKYRCACLFQHCGTERAYQGRGESF